MLGILFEFPIGLVGHPEKYTNTIVTYFRTLHSFPRFLRDAYTRTILLLECGFPESSARFGSVYQGTDRLKSVAERSFPGKEA